MKNSTSRILIETVVKKALREMKDSPERSVRNLVDMALNFSEGDSQKKFFSRVQTMLQNRQSSYYGLIQDVVSHIDKEWFLGFGMNVGYNSCTAGARKIREIEEQEHYNIPWSITLNVDHDADYHAVISEGQSLGIFTWILMTREKRDEVLQLVEDFPASAFVLFSEAEEDDAAFFEEAAALKNLMLAVQFEESSVVCDMLRDRGMPYSVYYIYNEENADEILNGNLFDSMESQHPLFAVLLSERTCPSSVREEVYAYVKKARDEQMFCMIPWEMAHDCCLVDSIISSEVCSAGFDEEGNLYAPYENRVMPEYNLHCLGLEEILRNAFPKKQEEQL